MRPSPRIRLLAVLAAMAAVGATAAPVYSAPRAQAAAGVQTAAAGASATTVTLVTGDRITVSTAPDGSRTYSAEPAPGSEPGTFLARSELNGETYFYPSDVIGQIGNRLDPQLFNVTALLRDGYDDSRRATLPLIVKPRDKEAVGELLPGGRALPSIGARTAALDKDDADELGDSLDAFSRIWLDGKVKAEALDLNLTQIKAPEAWAAGRTGKGVKMAVLDTGADPAHPDLAGRIGETKDFTGKGSTIDGQGHGTHVAATVAGSGAGVPGVRSGVAPDAELMIGKVLDDKGSGSDSQVIAGMEWAVAQGAKVVNMSLGSGPTDGSDPVSSALERLTTQSGALFVVSAGNSGPGVGTVSAPSIAPHALSVAAVDYVGGVASFSSRGPARAPGVVKPEISAPGVNIVAARAAGTSIGTVQSDPRYTALSGTSMAAPHVAGAAALLAQEHPDWKADRLKSALMGSATAPQPGQSLYDVGAGVVDAKAALAQTLIASTGAVDFGRMDTDAGSRTATRTVTLTNSGDAETTVSLAGTLASSGGTTPAGLLAVSPQSLTLAPGGSGEVKLTVDTTGTPTGAYSGALTATPASGGALRIPLVLDRAQTVSVSALDREGRPAPAQAIVVNTENGAGGVLPVPAGASTKIRIPEGPYMVLGLVAMEEDGKPAAALVTLDKPAASNEIVLDARKTRRWAASADGFDTRPEFLYGNLRRTSANGRYLATQSLIAGGAYGPFGRNALWITPTEGVQDGTVAFAEHWRLADAGSDHLTGDSSTMFDLAFGADKVPADPEHRLSRAEVADLARTRTEYKGFNENHRYQEGSTVYGTGLFGLNVSSPSYLSVPRERTEYRTARDVQWMRFTYRSKDNVSMNYAPRVFTYEPGSNSRDTWFAGPLTTRAAGTVTGARLQLSVDDAVDAQGRAAMLADFSYPQKGSFATRLYRNGELVSQKSTIDMTFADSGPATYRLQRTFTSGGVFPMGGETSASWTFSADGSSGTATPVRLLNASFSARLNGTNQARADRPLPLTARFTGASGELHGVRAWVTSDGGATWTAIESERDEDGNYAFTVPRTALKAGGFLGLRITAQDATGTTLDQALPRAIPVAP
ncbi:S8 family serine peptidase [Streptomyces sp. NPDC002596]